MDDFPFQEACTQKKEGDLFYLCAVALLFQEERGESKKVPESTSAVPISQEKDYKKNAAHMVDLDYSGSSNSK